MTKWKRQQLQMLRRYGLQVAAPYTSCNPYAYAVHSKDTSPLWGHCAAMAYAVQAISGGNIVTGRINGIQHYWNRLPDGTEIDLTSCQFGGNGWDPLKKGRLVRRRGKLVPLRFLLFMERIVERMKTDV